MSDPIKDLCLHDELDSAYKLIVAGFGNLQEIDMGNDFYHLPHQLLASGLERLLKCYICLVYEARHGSYPNTQTIKTLGHDLVKLSESISQDFFATNGIQPLKDDHLFLTSDKLLKSILHILSEFGKFARYYNLDIVTGSTNTPIDPRNEWEILENQIEDVTPYLTEDAREALIRDYYPRVHRQIIAKLERFIRAISMQFTLGKHGGKLLQYSSQLSSFRNLLDEDLGMTDYRRSVEILSKEKKNWIKRSENELQKTPWPTKTLSKAEFSGEWPFRAERVVIECREHQFCLVNIHGYDFALNGAAASCFSLPWPHDTGVAIIGKSVGPFIELAFELGKEQLPTQSEEEAAS